MTNQNTTKIGLFEIYNEFTNTEGYSDKLTKGGNGVLYFYKDGTAIKKLEKVTKEKKDRFFTEFQVLNEIKETESLENICELREVNPNENWFRMKRYEGDSNKLLERTKYKVEFTVKIIIPIIETLKHLSERIKPIYHRDLKPDNLLYETKNGEVHLILADFGCAYFYDEDEERLTPDFRAVGARAYLAPEYHHGRVEHVDEKGDIYSIGKLLWYFVNGVKDDIFPYNLWFPEVYNIQNRQRETKSIAKLNLIIARCVHHDPSKRINYNDLINMLKSIIYETEIDDDEEAKLKLYEVDAKNQIETEISYKHILNMIMIFYEDAKNACIELKRIYPHLSLISEMDPLKLRDLSYYNSQIKSLVQSISYSLWNESETRLVINCNLWNPNMSEKCNMVKVDKNFICVEIISINTSEIQQIQQICYFYEDLDLKLKLRIDQVEKEIMNHNSKMLLEQIKLAVDHWGS